MAGRDPAICAQTAGGRMAMTVRCTANVHLASILLHVLTEFLDSADLSNEGPVPDPKR